MLSLYNTSADENLRNLIYFSHTKFGKVTVELLTLNCHFTGELVKFSANHQPIWSCWQHKRAAFSVKSINLFILLGI